MTAEHRAELARMANSSLLPHRKVVQARALLLAAGGVANEEIAEAGIADGHVGPRLSRAATSGGGPAYCTRSRTDYEIRLIWYR